MGDFNDTLPGAIPFTDANDLADDWLANLPVSETPTGDPQAVYARAAVELTAALYPLLSDSPPDALGGGPPPARVVSAHIFPEQVTITRKPHTHADTCEITIKGSAGQIDPRPISDLICDVFLGRTNTIDGALDTQSTWRFLGSVEEDADSFGDRPGEIKLSFSDLSGPMRRHKPCNSDVLPFFKETLRNFLQRAIDLTPAVKGRLTLRSTAALDNELPLKSRLADDADVRSAKGRIPAPKKDASTWEVMDYVCGLLGLHLKVDKNELVVRHYGEFLPTPWVRNANEPKLVFRFYDDQANVLSVTRRKRFVQLRRGVKVWGFDKTNRKRISAVWPPDGELPKKALAPAEYRQGADKQALKNAKAAGKAPSARAGQKATGSQVTGKVTNDQQRDCYWVRDIHTESGLLEHAKSICALRFSEEIEGTIETSVWNEDTLSLQNGDRIQLKINPILEAELAAIQSESERIRFLEERLGLDPTAAELMSAVSSHYRGDLFYVKSVQLQWFASQAPTIKIDFVNIIDV